MPEEGKDLNQLIPPDFDRKASQLERHKDETKKAVSKLNSLSVNDPQAEELIDEKDRHEQAAGVLANDLSEPVVEEGYKTALDRREERKASSDAIKKENRATGGGMHTQQDPFDKNTRPISGEDINTPEEN